MQAKTATTVKRKACQIADPPALEPEEGSKASKVEASSVPNVKKQPAANTTASSASTYALTPEALKKHDEQIKNKLRQGAMSEVDFEQAMGKEGMQRQWQNFAYARRANPEVEGAFKDLSKLGRGAQQNAKKKMLLFAWLKDPTFGTGYMSIMTSLEFGKKQKKALTWLTWKQTIDKHGSSEAVAMVKAGTLVCRRNPQDKRFWQFLSIEDSVEMTMVQKKQATGTRTGKVSGGQLENFEQAALAVLEEDMVEDILSGKDSTGLELKDLQALKKVDKEKDKEEDGSEQDEDEDLPADLARVIGLQEAKKDKKDTTKPTPQQKQEAKEKVQQARRQKAVEAFDKKVDLHSQVGDKDNLAKARSKCCTMHSMMTSMVQQMKITIKGLNKGKIEYPKEKTQLILDKLDKHIGTMDKIIADGTSLEQVKKSLMLAAASLKKANEQHVGNMHFLDQKKS